MPPNDTLSNQGRYEPVARAAAKAYGIPESFFISLLTAENSTWDPTLPSYDKDKNGKPNSIGIGQLTEGAAQTIHMDPADRVNPYKAIAGSAQIISQLMHKYNNDWWKVAAAYNAGEKAVDDAVKEASVPDTSQGTYGIPGLSAINGILGNTTTKDWRTVLAAKSPDYVNTIAYTKKIVDNATNPQNTGPNPNDFAAAAAKSDPSYKPTPVTSSVPGVNTSAPPDISDSRYLQQNDDGSWSQNYDQWSKDNYQYYQSEKIKRDLEAPQNSYYDDVIKEISAEIAAGNLDFNKAKEELDTRTSTFNTVMSNADNLLKYAVPAGSEYYPGGEPGGMYDRMGVRPSHPSTVPIDLFGQALDINNQASQRLGQVRSIDPAQIAAALRTIYPNQAPLVQGPDPSTEQPGQAWTPQGQVPVQAVPVPQSQGPSAFEAALAQVQSQATSGDEQLQRIMMGGN